MTSQAVGRAALSVTLVVLVSAVLVLAGTSCAGRESRAPSTPAYVVPRPGRVATVSFSDTMPPKSARYPRMKGTLRIAIPDYAAAPDDLRMRLSFDFARELAWTMGMYPEYVPTAFEGESAENPASPAGIFDRVLERRAEIGVTGEYYGSSENARRAFPGLVMSEPYYDRGSFLVALADSELESLTDVKGLVVETDGYQDRALSRLVPGVRLRRAHVAGGREWLSAKLADLRAGRVSAVTVSSDEYLFAYGRQGLSDLRVLTPTVETQPVSIALRADSRLVETVNQAIRSMRKRGVLRRLELKWRVPAFD